MLAVNKEINQLLLTHTQVLSENITEIHALVFQLPKFSLYFYQQMLFEWINFKSKTVYFVDFHGKTGD